MNRKLKRNAVRNGVVGTATALGLASMAHAAVDVTAVTGAGTDVAAVGAAVFAVYVGVKLFKWIRSAL
ncbi:MAG TPA: major capsid protein [Burkholderiaceae bacterium]|nr:major capsid protein [Burkholderiaceae bacterium]